MVDTLGLLLMVVVHSAGVQDAAGAREVLSRMITRFPRIRIVWADNIYKGKLVKWVWLCFGWLLDVVKRDAIAERKVKGFQVLPKRWIVERTFAWLGRYRRLSKDYEFHPLTSETFIYMGMVLLMTRRLARS